MKLTHDIVTGKPNSITVDVTRNTTVLQLKEKIQDIDGIPVDQQRIIAAGKQLEDKACLGEYLDKGYTNFHLVLRMRGC